MEYYISDTHFGHANCIHSCNRPYKDWHEMNRSLLDAWNARVHKNDTVYVLGDFFWNKKIAVEILPLLKGKIVLIEGNHDANWYRPTAFSASFAAIYPMALYRRDASRLQTLCHYPMVEWKNSKVRGIKRISYHIYGHTHNEIPEALLYSFHALNACVEVNGYAPVTWEELIENNQTYRLQLIPSPEKRAFLLADRYHATQVDKAGAPYIEHPLSVSASCPDENSRTVALLHDTLEDTELTEVALRRWFSAEIADAVCLLTRPADMPYEAYVRRIKPNPLAKTVKLADLRHNMDLSRLPSVTDRDRAREQKYQNAVRILTE